MATFDVEQLVASTLEPMFTDGVLVAFTSLAVVRKNYKVQLFIELQKHIRTMLML
jgi:hypothetical protein